MASDDPLTLQGCAAPSDVLAQALTTNFVPTGSVWKYLDNGSNQGTAWRDPGFNDAAWASGSAQLGYGDGDEATVVRFGPNASAKYITTYFRHTFSVTNAASYTGLTLRVLRDDGAAVYLNGTEVLRDNMPTGTIGYTTPASAAIDDSTFHTASVSPVLLVDGTNFLAVEIHQANGTSSDISLDLDLVGGDAGATASVTRGPYLQRGSAGGAQCVHELHRRPIHGPLAHARRQRVQQRDGQRVPGGGVQHVSELPAQQCAVGDARQPRRRVRRLRDADRALLRDLHAADPGRSGRRGLRYRVPPRRPARPTGW